MHGHVVANVFKMLCNTLGNIYFACGNSQLAHQVDGVAIGAIGGAKTRHSDANNALARQAKFVERAHTNEQSQRGV